MSSLERFVERARSTSVDFDAERSARVLAGTIAKRDKRITRDRLVRRGVVGVGVAAFIGFVLLRGAGASQPVIGQGDSDPPTPPGETSEVAAFSSAVAVHALNDGGYARD